MSLSKQSLKENYIFGLDIGTRSIVGIVGYLTASSFNVVADCVYEHDTRAMIDGQIYDIEKVTESVRRVKHDLEKQLGCSLEKVCIAAAGRVLRTNMIHVEQAIEQNTAIDDDRVFALELLGIEKAHQEMNCSLEGHESGFHCVGYTVSKYYLNNYEISKLQGHKGKRIGADVLSTFLPKEVVESLHKVVIDAGLEVQHLTLEPIAAINIAIPSEYRLLNIALVDIGAGTSDIAITKEGSIMAYGMIPMAGDEITEAIVHAYLVDFKTGEAIKLKASTQCKTIVYKDIMGLQHTIKREDVLMIIDPVVEKLADRIGDKIIELNGGRSTNAVFIVGGGGQVPVFTSLLAKKLQILEERVALRGKSVMEKVKFETNRKKSPELVTPLGICFSGLENNKKEFLQVYLNDEPIKVFDNNNITVMDIVAFKGLNPKNLIAKRGNDLSFYINGLQKTIRGEVGDPAQILINNIPANLNDRVLMNDYIVIVPAKKGKDAELSTHQLLQQIEPLHIQINTIGYTYKPKLMVNNTLTTMNYDLRLEDQVETVLLMVKEIFNQLNIFYNGQPITINNKPCDLETIVQDQDILHFEVLEEKIKEIQQKNTNSIHVIVNSQPIELNSKQNYVIADVFDEISFDLTQLNGVVVCEINGENMPYLAPIQHGDVITIYWSNDK